MALLSHIGAALPPRVVDLSAILTALHEHLIHDLQASPRILLDFLFDIAHTELMDLLLIL